MTTVTEQSTAIAEKAITYKTIVVALDGSRLAEEVLPHVESLAWTYASRVILVCALEPIEASVSGDLALAGVGMVGAADALYDAREAQRDVDASYLAKLKGKLDGRGFSVDYREPEGTAAEAIVRVARREHADLIAMTTHGRSGISRAVLGSVADDVVRHAPCPVLLVHPC